MGKVVNLMDYNEKYNIILPPIYGSSSIYFSVSIHLSILIYMLKYIQVTSCFIRLNVKLININFFIIFNLAQLEILKIKMLFRRM